MNTLVNNNGYLYITNGEEYQDFPEGILINKIKLIPNIAYFLREKTLYNIGMNVIQLNPEWSDDELFNYLNSINHNKKFILTAVKFAVLQRIIKRIFKNFDGEAEIIPNTLVYTIYSKDCTMTKEERRQHTNKFTGERRRTKTKQLIYDAINNWDFSEKITQSSIGNKIGKNKHTVKKYWEEFKGIVHYLNNQHKSPITNKLVEEVETIIEDKTDVTVEDLLNYLSSIEDKFKKPTYYHLASAAIKENRITTIEEINELV